MKLKEVRMRSIKYALLCILTGLTLLNGELAVAQVEGTYADLPGVRLWYTDTGGDGAAVILLHPDTGTSESWLNQDQEFAHAGYRVVAFDRRGWGRSMATGNGSQPGTVAGDLYALADFLHIEKFYLIGEGGGGFAALDFAAWHPERLLGLIVAASNGAFTDGEMTAFRKRIEIPGLKQQPPEFIELGLSYRGSNPEGTEQWISIERRARQIGAAYQPLRTPNTLEKIAAIQVPTLVISADCDLYAPQLLVRDWASKIRGAQFVVVEDAGHSVAWEKPTEFNRLALAFMGKQ
jgi:pimeloyl-ACP methyl ester carboxylesterase